MLIVPCGTYLSYLGLVCLVGDASEIGIQMATPPEMEAIAPWEDRKVDRAVYDFSYRWSGAGLAESYCSSQSCDTSRVRRCDDIGVGFTIGLVHVRFRGHWSVR